MAGWLKTLPHFAPLSDAQARRPRCATLYAYDRMYAGCNPITSQRVKLAQNTESISFAAGEVILREGADLVRVRVS